MRMKDIQDMLKLTAAKIKYHIDLEAREISLNDRLWDPKKR